ncbi:MAG: carboxypeptidase regulatory-like domain-containing protein [archaeon]
MVRRFVFLFVLLLALDVVSATRIHGSIYDTSLELVEGAVVEVNSVPVQRFVSKDGSYSFNLNQGTYTVTARYSGMHAKESVVINDDSGDYVIDLFLFPTFEEEEELLNETNLGVNDSFFQDTASNGYAWLVLGLVIVLAVVVFVLWRKKSKKVVKHNGKEESKDVGDLDSVVDFIKKEGGRVTQKDIRRKFPLSEAKISLIISEMEHKGIVEKIKKGRGNIIVLKK